MLSLLHLWIIYINSGNLIELFHSVKIFGGHKLDSHWVHRYTFLKNLAFETYFRHFCHPAQSENDKLKFEEALRIQFIPRDKWGFNNGIGAWKTWIAIWFSWFSRPIFKKQYFYTNLNFTFLIFWLVFSKSKSFTQFLVQNGLMHHQIAFFQRLIKLKGW